MIAPASPTPAASRPTRVRHQVVGVVILVGMIVYLDRACIAKMAPNIMADLGLTKVQMGYAFSAFALAYTIFEIPTAWLADRSGTRSVFARIVVWWSAFTMATGAAMSYTSLLIIRFLFGMGEAGAWPCMARTFSRWIPRSERGTVQGIFFAGAHLGGAVTPFIVAALLTVMPWRFVFLSFGLLGFVWALAWYRWFRNEPAEHPAVNEAERLLIEDGRAAEVRHEMSWAYWKTMLGSWNVTAICLMYFPNTFVFYFCITWLPTYLSEKHGFTGSTADFFSGLPLFLSVAGDLFGGVLTDFAVKRFGLRAGRCGVGAATYAVATLALLIVPQCANPVTAAVLVAVAVAATMTSLAAAWSCCVEIGGNQAAVVSAAMNSAGQVGSLVCPLLVAYTLKWYGDWNITIYSMAVLLAIGTGCWCVINPTKRVFAN